MNTLFPRKKAQRKSTVRKTKGVESEQKKGKKAWTRRSLGGIPATRKMAELPNSQVALREKKNQTDQRPLVPHLKSVGKTGSISFRKGTISKIKDWTETAKYGKANLAQKK